MTDFNRNTELSIPCPDPDCAHEFKERVGRLESNPQLTCPSCGSTVNINGNELRETMRQLDSIPREINFKIG